MIGLERAIGARGVSPSGRPDLTKQGQQIEVVVDAGEVA